MQMINIAGILVPVVSVSFH